MGFSSIGSYSLYSQQYAANNEANNSANSTATQAETAKAMLHDVRSQIANGTLGDISDNGDTVSISNASRIALAALLALQKDNKAQDSAKDAEAAQVQKPAEERVDVVQKRAEAVMRAYFH